MTIVQRNSGTWTAGSFTASVASAPGGTSKFVVLVEADTTVTTPSGFTLRASSVTNAGQYLFERTAAGGTTSQAFTTGAGGGSWFAFEVAGTYNTPAATGSESSTTASTYTSPSHTPPAGTSDIIVGFVSEQTDTVARSISGITGGFTLQAQGQAQVTDWPIGAEGDQQAAGGSAYTSTATWSSNTTVRGALIGSYTSSGAAAATPHRHGGKWAW